jgi:plasmid stabilization system protein ParE
MPAKLLWSLQAREDLLDIYVAIGVENAEAAERLYSAIEAKANLLITHPRIWRASTRNSPICPNVD